MTYAVVIVNWNGADDTIACLASLVGSPQATVIVVDNGSTDDSVARILVAMERLKLQTQRGDRDACFDLAGPARAAVIEAGENLGFAAGCNLGLRIASAAGLPLVVFLNNDTIVESDALDVLTGHLEQHADCFASVPMITVHGTDSIWNCGGRVYSFGVRRYHLAGRPRKEGERLAQLQCSFFTGCCFAVRTPAFIARGGFSERFFFGEEDFELALWMKDKGLMAVCLPAAVVQHKVSASFSQAAGGRLKAKVFLYYLNRFIHMRLRFGLVLWWLWVVAYLPYVIALLSRSMPPPQIPAFIAALMARARTMERVTRGDFEDIMNGKLRWS